MSYTKKFLLVAAIDFGTTYSGFAFSFRHEYDLNPLKVNVHTWSAGSGGLMSLKSPTCMLFDPDQNFNSFGYEAEEKYEDLAMDNEHQNWYFFRRFKMTLYDAMTLEREFLLYDVTGKPMMALTVFSDALKYLKTKLFSMCQEMTTNLTQSDIGWVITVPSIWTDASKQFMREAAEKAGIPETNVMLALESDSASLLCKCLPVDKIGKEEYKAFEKGSKYMVIDAGGGTVDITVHEVMPDLYVKEIYKANGGPWGGTTVDDEFCNLLSDVVGRDCFQSFTKAESYDYLELMREFEQKKRTIKSDGSNRVRMRIPASLNDACRKANGKMSLNDMTRKHQLEKKLVIIGDKITLSSECVLQLFKRTIDKIADHIHSLLLDPNVKAISTIVMVGGFSECEILKTKIRRTFPNLKVIIPNEAGLAVLKGAVMFGHNSSTIKERISRFSYGVRTTTLFKPDVHDESKKILIGKETRCDDIFSKHIELSQSVKIGVPLKSESYSPANTKQKTININVYASTEKNPMYVTDRSCIKLGRIGIDLSGISDENKSVNVAMTFGKTELQVKATSENGKEVKAYFNCLR